VTVAVAVHVELQALGRAVGAPRLERLSAPCWTLRQVVVVKIKARQKDFRTRLRPAFLHEIIRVLRGT
jgi:hypothetical protein